MSVEYLIPNFSSPTVSTAMLRALQQPHFEWDQNENCNRRKINKMHFKRFLSTHTHQHTHIYDAHCTRIVLATAKQKNKKTSLRCG